MANMSYCVLENTSKDLRDALAKIRECEVSDWSRYEMDGAREIFDLCTRILDYQENTLDALKKLDEDED